MEPMLKQISIITLPLLFAVTLHEAAHAWVADRKGDPTARILGRISLNPWVHVDLFGTLLIPILLFTTTGMLFGYAKPVPVNARNLHRPKQDMAWVAAAGPGMNFLLALISGAIYRSILAWDPHLTPVGGNPTVGSFVLTPVLLMLHFSVQVNLLLMVFNLIPIPPLDGGRVLAGLLPERGAQVLRRIEPYGMLLLVALMFLDPFDLMQKTISPLTHFFSRLIFGA